MLSLSAPVFVPKMTANIPNNVQTDTNGTSHVYKPKSKNAIKTKEISLPRTETFNNAVEAGFCR